MIQELGNYLVMGVLGDGAMGIVYRALDRASGRVVALKTLHPGVRGAAEQAALTGRFRNEAQAAARLDHPNIVRVHEFHDDGHAASPPYIAMELVEGATLDTLLPPGQPAALPQLLAWMGDLLGGLNHAHARGVVHRDIKPRNLLVTPDGRLRISDFGVAQIASPLPREPASMVGTPNYMSPEQFRGDPVDGRADLFSAGIVLYQLLTGARPFDGSTATVMRQILHDQPAPPSAMLATLGTGFDQVLATATAKSPAARYHSAQAMYEAVLHAAGVPPPPPPAPGCAARDARTPMAPWKHAALPDVAALLASQIGPSASFLLENAAGQADSFDTLAELLLAHIPSERGRIQFRLALVQVKHTLAVSAD